MCTVLLPPGDNPIAVNKYIISYHKVSISRLCLQVESSLAGTGDLFVRNENGLLQEEFRGLNVSYPDFFNDAWQENFSCNIGNLANKVDGILRGFVLQENWPASTATHNSSEDIPVAEVSYISI